MLCYFYTILYYTMLYYTILYDTILYYTILSFRDVSSADPGLAVGLAPFLRELRAHIPKRLLPWQIVCVCTCAFASLCVSASCRIMTA